MSVAAQLAYCGGKRYYEEEGEDPRSAEAKRSRHQAGSPRGRCALHPNAAYALGQSAVAALKGLFPEMTDKAIADVLAEYGDNVDAAIKHLTELRLASSGANGAAGPATDAALAEPVAPGKPAVEQPAAAGAAPAPAAPPAGEPAGSAPTSAEDWVEAVVQQMAEASDLDDARRRARTLFQAFEQAVLRHSGGGPGARGAARAEHHQDSVTRENALLKRAVAIQSARLAELGAREAEVAGMRDALAAAQQRAAALELQCYSLQLHLRAAADDAARGSAAGGAAGPPPPPDVF